MNNTPVQYPFFNLIRTEGEAELALSVLTEYGNPREQELLKPEAESLQQDFMRSDGQISLATAVNKLLTMYLDAYGEFSDELMIFLSKSLVEQKLAKAL